MLRPESLCGLPLRLKPSTSYSIHFFTQSLSSFCNICPHHCNVFRCRTEIMSSNASLSLFLELYLYLNVTNWLFSSLPTEVPSQFLCWQTRYHFHVTYYFAHNCCTVSLSLSMIYPYWYQPSSASPSPPKIGVKTVPLYWFSDASTNILQNGTNMHVDWGLNMHRTLFTQTYFKAIQRLLFIIFSRKKYDQCRQKPAYRSSFHKHMSRQRCLASPLSELGLACC